MGVANDGKNSVMRYIKNNFFDGLKQVRPPFLNLAALRPMPLMTDEREMAGRCLQDGYDLLTGRWSVSKPGEKERLSRILVDDRHLTLRAVRSSDWPLP
jgi:hypothetical protein